MWTVVKISCSWSSMELANARWSGCWPSPNKTIEYWYKYWNRQEIKWDWAGLDDRVTGLPPICKSAANTIAVAPPNGCWSILMECFLSSAVGVEDFAKPLKGRPENSNQSMQRCRLGRSFTARWLVFSISFGQQARSNWASWVTGFRHQA